MLFLETGLNSVLFHDRRCFLLFVVVMVLFVIYGVFYIVMDLDIALYCWCFLNVFCCFLLPQGTSVCQTAVQGAGVILLFLSRACYNLAVLMLSKDHKVEAFDFDWYNVSDQVHAHTATEC